MIIIDNVTKKYHTRSGEKTVLSGINLKIAPGEKIGIVGRNGAGKSTLIRLISGVEFPTHGAIHRGMSISWPLAFGGAFQVSLTGIDNIKFICRVYDADIRTVIDFVNDFAELGAYLYEPVRKYSAGMRAKLAFAISMAIEFDCFLIDEVVAVGDSRFHEKCLVELFGKRSDRAMIIVSHDMSYIQAHCDRAAVLNKGVLHPFDDVNSAYEYYSGMM